MINESLTLWQAVVLGAVQGLTEFLPISSSGHLVLFQTLFGLKDSMLAFDILVHWGTLLAVTIYFWDDLWQLTKQSLLFVAGLLSGNKPTDLFTKHPFSKTALLIIVASVPTAIMGIAFEDFFESLFHSVQYVALAWLFMGVLLILSRKFQSEGHDLSMLTVKAALAIGVAQGIAIIPGCSRSGMTILAAMLLGMRKEDAARFSFLLAFPTILGAGLLKLAKDFSFDEINMSVSLGGFLVAAVVGYAAILLLLKMVAKGKLYYFGYYCLGLSVLTFIFVR